MSSSIYRIARHALAHKALGALLALSTSSAFAGISYKLDRPAASPGETVHVQAVFFNETQAGTRWNVPTQIVLQWRGAQGQPIRSLARLPGGAVNLNIPVNNFARVSWDAVVPRNVRGLQAVSIEGESALMALDTSGRENGSPATASAHVPVTDARTGKPLPAAEVASAGASPEKGPAPEASATAQPAATPSAFDRFASAITPLDPVYFDLGTRGRRTARFQISAKYRLFTPDSGKAPAFYQNLYLGYTQTSLWDLQGASQPFIDTTYNPSAFWSSDSLWASRDQNWRAGLASGLEHRSNGKAGRDSRSLNDAFIKPSINYRFDAGSTLSFEPKVMHYVDVASENRDYAAYAGHVDWNLKYAQDNGAVVTAMYRQGDAQRRTTELDFAWPLKRTWLNMNGYLHVQYFNGYGETLLGYNQRNESQIRLGLALVP